MPASVGTQLSAFTAECERVEVNMAQKQSSQTADTHAGGGIESALAFAPGHDGDPRTPGVLVGNPVRLAGGANRVMLIPDDRRSHATVVGCTPVCFAEDEA
jgi:hypothetical protein